MIRTENTMIRNELESDLVVRAIWKGAVSFGLVNVPVRLYSATENHDVQFRQVHREDGGRIKYQRTCSIDGEQVSYDDIAKGYETEDGQMVVLTDEDLAALPTRSSREIAVEKFVPANQIDPMFLDKSYYLEPEKTAVKPYGLLRDALKAADRMAIVTVSLRARMTIAVLRVRDDVIVMQTMLWPDEVRSPEFAGLDGATETKPAELAMANMLVESLSGDYDPQEYEDDYKEAVEALVKAKLEGGEVKEVPAARESGGEVVDLLAALQRSVERAKASRGEPASEVFDDHDQDGEDTAEADLAPEPAEKAVKERTAGKVPAKKALAKKTTAKKTSARKKAAS
jgi:DNA end-binding protein Ku